MATQLGRMVTYLEELLTIQSNNALIAWSFSKSRDKQKLLYLHYKKTYGYQTWQNGNVP